MSMFPHTVTVYNVTAETDAATITEKVVNHITILKGVLLSASKAANVRKSGLEGADAVNLYIPYFVQAVDGITGQEKQYAEPMEFWRMADKSGHWTLSVSGHGGKTIFVKGEVVEPDMTEEKISLTYDDVYNVTKVDKKDYGRLQNIQVGGA